LSQFNDDLNESSFILDEFHKKEYFEQRCNGCKYVIVCTNFPYLEFYQSDTTTKKYATYFNFTIRALENLEEYLWNMGKFYETSKTDYAITARMNFNTSMYYYEKGREGISL